MLQASTSFAMLRHHRRVVQGLFYLGDWFLLLHDVSGSSPQKSIFSTMTPMAAATVAPIVATNAVPSTTTMGTPSFILGLGGPAPLKLTAMKWRYRLIMKPQFRLIKDIFHLMVELYWYKYWPFWVYVGVYDYMLVSVSMYIQTYCMYDIFLLLLRMWEGGGLDISWSFCPYLMVKTNKMHEFINSCIQFNRQH